MDIYRIDDDIKFINNVGYTLNIEEKYFIILIF